MDIKILFFLVLNFYCIYSSPFDVDHLIKRGEKMCGDKLWMMVSKVCDGIYYSPGPNKRLFNAIYNLDEDDESDEDNLDENVIFPFLQKESAKSLIPRKLPKSYGIVNECCYKPCTRAHIRLYCALK